MNVFTRLLKLYKTNLSRVPLEDFITELLVAILSQNKKLLDDFANQVLELEGENFQIDSQQHYLLVGSQNCRIDVVIKNIDTLCFLESKVEANEGFEQLIRYSKVLDGYSPQYKTYLCYCTKYVSEKAYTDHNFRQLRWLDIAKFLRKRNDSDLINEYLNFLKDNNMNVDTNFTAVDLLALQNLNPIIFKMQNHLDKIAPAFKKYFGDIAKKDVNHNYGQIRVHSRFILHRDSPFGTNGGNEIGAGFSFKDTPMLMVWIWCGDKNSKFIDYKRIPQDKTNEFTISVGHPDVLELKKPLSDFISKENMDIEIEKWFEESFSKVREFANSTRELEWNI